MAKNNAEHELRVRSKNKSKLIDRSLAWGSVVVFLCMWEWVSSNGWANPLFVSSPSRIYNAGAWLFANGFWTDIQVSATEFGVGLLLAIGVGLPFGMLLGWYPRIYALFEVFIVALYATPRIALLPILILWLGIGIESKIAIIFLGGFFPIFVNVITGIKQVDLTLLRCARSFGASDRQILLTLALPSSLPFIIAGLQLAVGRGLVGVVVGELVASTAGIGHMMSVAGSTFQTDKVFVGIILLGATGYTLTYILQCADSHFSSWKVNPNQSG